MAANGISTLPSKLDRKLAKIALATEKRQRYGTIGFRVLNDYTGSVSPTIGRPWSQEPPFITGGDATTVPTSRLDGGNASVIVNDTIEGGNATTVF